MNDTLFNISFNELCQVEGIESELVIEIVEYGIAMPLDKNTDPTKHEQWLFDTNSIYWIKKALRLYQDLEIDWVAIAIVIELMQEKQMLENKNLSFERRLRRFTKL